MSGDHDADVIVVGAGMLGGLAAERLALGGKSVLMLEAGPRVSRWRLIDAFRRSPDHGDAMYPELAYAPKGGGGRYSDTYVESVGPVPFRPAMLKLVGGTTWHWSSAFWRFLPNDFKVRSVYGVGRDWPIGYDELEPYYTEVERITGAAGGDGDDQGGGGGKPFPLRSAPYPLPPEPLSTYTQTVAKAFAAVGYGFTNEPHLRATRPFDGRPTCCGNNNCSPICPIGAMFTGDRAVTRAEAAGASLLPDTVAVRLEIGAGGRIVAVHTRSPDGTSARRTARAYVLAAHAIETPKLMMISGVGTRSGQLGRNLMTHPSMIFEALARDPIWPGRGPTQQGAWCGKRDGPHRARHAGFKYHANNNVPNRSVTERLLDQGVIGAELDARIRHDAARFVSIIGGMDMLPDPANRMTLSDRKDAFGIPTPRVRFDNDAYVAAGGAAIEQDFAKLERAFPIETRLGPPGPAKARPASAHVMGTTIMGDDPADSVVDRDCRVWDHPNLYVASAAVFASPASVNPTLTGAALSLRIADLLVRET